ncbi:leucine rich repeat protein [Cystoisospora suis]|uniref:Leucine rich repeat protein n=1 Tax=Cystoisospora suis TaxID=483139 RepID=A0A2C6KXT3_9APIC|nr:leucine rich repeat protein [Cystoisospora suis]
MAPPSNLAPDDRPRAGGTIAPSRPCRPPLSNFGPSFSNTSSYPPSSGSTPAAVMAGSAPFYPLPAPSVLFGRHSRFSSALRFDRSSGGSGNAADARGGRAVCSLQTQSQHVSLHIALQRKGLRDTDIREFVQWLSSCLQNQLRQFPSTGRGAPLLPGGVGAGGPAVAQVVASAPASGGSSSSSSGGKVPAANNETCVPFLFTCCLDVSENYLTAEGLSHLLGFFQSHGASFRLAKLKLYKNRLGDAGASVLASFIQSAAPLLPSGTLSRGGSGKSGSSTNVTSSLLPGQRLSPPPPLEELHLSHCEITAKGCLCLLDAVAQVRDERGRHLYPRYDSARRSLVPLWLRLEYNYIHDPVSLLKQWSASVRSKRPLPSVSGAAPSSASANYASCSSSSSTCLAPPSFTCFAEKLNCGSGSAASRGSNSASGNASTEGTYFHCTPARCCRATASFAPIFHLYMITHQSASSGTASLALSGTLNSPSHESSSGSIPVLPARSSGSAGPLPALIGTPPPAAAHSGPSVPPTQSSRASGVVLTGKGGHASGGGDGEPRRYQQSHSGRRRSIGSATAVAGSAGGSGGGQLASRKGSRSGSKLQPRGRARSSSGGAEGRTGGFSGRRDVSTGLAANSQTNDHSKGGNPVTSSETFFTVGSPRASSPGRGKRGGCQGTDDRSREVKRGDIRSSGAHEGRASKTAEDRDRYREGLTSPRSHSVVDGPAVEVSGDVVIDKAEVGKCLPLYIFIDASAVLGMAEQREKMGVVPSAPLFFSFSTLEALCAANGIVHRGESSGRWPSARGDSEEGGTGPLHGLASFPNAPESDLTLLLVVDAVQQELLGMSSGGLGSKGVGNVAAGRKGIDALEQLHRLATNFCLVEYVGCVHQPQAASSAVTRTGDSRRGLGGNGSVRGVGSERSGVATTPANASGQGAVSVDMLLGDEAPEEEADDFTCLTPEEIVSGQRDSGLSVHTLKTIDYALLWKAHLEEVSMHANPSRDTAELMFFITANPEVQAFVSRIALPADHPEREAVDGTLSAPCGGGSGSNEGRAFLPCFLLHEFSEALEDHAIKPGTTSNAQEGSNSDACVFGQKSFPSVTGEFIGETTTAVPLTAADFRQAGTALLRHLRVARQADSCRGARASTYEAGQRACASNQASGSDPLLEGQGGTGLDPGVLGRGDCRAQAPSRGVGLRAERVREKRNSNVSAGGNIGSSAPAEEEGASVRRHASGGDADRAKFNASQLLPSLRDSLSSTGLRGESENELTYPTFLPPLIGTGFSSEAFLRDSSGSGDHLNEPTTVFRGGLPGPPPSRNCPLRGGEQDQSSAPGAPVGRRSGNATVAALLGAARAGGTSAGSGNPPSGRPPSTPGSAVCEQVMTVAELEELQLKMRRQHGGTQGVEALSSCASGAAGLDRLGHNRGRIVAVGEERNTAGNSAPGRDIHHPRSPFLLPKGPLTADSGLFGVPLGAAADEASSSSLTAPPFDAAESGSIAAAVLPLLTQQSRPEESGGGGPACESGSPDEEFLLQSSCESGSREKVLQQSHGGLVQRGAGDVLAAPRETEDRQGLTDVEIKCELIDAIAIVQELSSRLRLLSDNYSSSAAAIPASSNSGAPVADALMTEDLLRRARNCVARWRQLLVLADAREQLVQQAPLSASDQLPLSPEWLTPPHRSRLDDPSYSGSPEDSQNSAGGPVVVLPPLQMQHSRPASRGCWTGGGQGGDQQVSQPPPMHHTSWPAHGQTQSEQLLNRSHASSFNQQGPHQPGWVEGRAPGPVDPRRMPVQQQWPVETTSGGDCVGRQEGRHLQQGIPSRQLHTPGQRVSEAGMPPGSLGMGNCALSVSLPGHRGL